MCAAMVGADPDALDQLASAFDRQAQALDSTAARVRAQVRSSPWVGGAANRFRADWDGTHMPRLRQTSTALRGAATTLRREATDQRRASGSAGGASGQGGRASGATSGGSAGGSNRAGAKQGPSFVDLLSRGTDLLIDGSEVAGHLADIVKEETGLTLKPYASAALKGIGLGAAAADLATAIENRDLSGGLAAVADGGFGLVTKFGPGLIYTGIKEQLEFYIPLTAEAQDEHMSWMTKQGYSGAELAERYQGLQGFVTLGNDNVERKAPWINDVADNVMQKPAEWLYNHGIKLY